MADVVRLQVPRDDTLWAVMASLGRTHRIADIYADRNAALADRHWREQQVSAYSGFLSTSRQPLPSYSVAPIRRADLPKSWKPLPALGFLRASSPERRARNGLAFSSPLLLQPGPEANRTGG